MQSPHFKAFRIPVEGLQTVLPKRVLKKAVDRNGLRRIIRESARACHVSAVRVVLTNNRGFDGCPSRRALKLAWRAELDAVLMQLR